MSFGRGSRYLNSVVCSVIQFTAFYVRFLFLTLGNYPNTTPITGAHEQLTHVEMQPGAWFPLRGLAFATCTAGRDLIAHTYY